MIVILNSDLNIIICNMFWYQEINFFFWNQIDVLNNNFPAAKLLFTISYFQLFFL